MQGGEQTGHPGFGGLWEAAARGSAKGHALGNTAGQEATQANGQIC